MSFEGQINRIPRAFSRELGLESAAFFSDYPRVVRELICGVCGTSPYLKSLVDTERLWLNAALSDPEKAIKAATASVINRDKLAAELRLAKRRVALWIALCDLSGIWTLEQCTETLSDFADLAVKNALRLGVQRQVERGQIPGFGPDDDLDMAGIFVLAMGKMGARELNYSSDIDLICLFDDSQLDPSDFYKTRGAFIRATREMSSTLNDITSDGYVFRTDLRLRPDPSVTPVCIGTDAAERYYESLGRTWERAAYIKARVVGGDFAAGKAFLERMQPFVWRKHLDFAAIEDAHNMRLAIRDHKALGGPLSLEGHDMKLGRGGIREIEFFTQTRQLISGGRESSLRDRQTVKALTKLAENNWVEKKTAAVLKEHYRSHRIIEHRLQMMYDLQTHALPKSSEGFERLCCLVDQDNQTLRDDLLSRLNEVHELTEGFFAGPSIVLSDTKHHNNFDEIVDRWSNYAALKSKRALNIFARLKPVLLNRFKVAAKPQEAIIAFDGFLAGLPAGVQLFSMFESHPKLIDLLLDIVVVSPTLAHYVSRNSEVFDVVMSASFWQDWAGKTVLLKEFCEQIYAAKDYEAKLDTARRLKKEWHFRIGVHLLRGLINAEEAGQQYSELAEILVKGLWPEVIKNFSIKHGPPPGRGAVVLGMGSIGLSRLHPESDLDLIIIYDSKLSEASDGKRPLSSRQYYARLTQALVTALSAQMTEGRLYKVDMRLRPSGNKGPVATSWPAFKSYQTQDAWIWEHLALSRARVIAGPESLAKDVENFRISLFGNTQQDLAKLALAKMRLRIARAKGRHINSFNKAVLGCLQDIELVAQLGRLLEGGAERDVASGLKACFAIGILNCGEVTQIKEIYKLLWKLRVAVSLLGEFSFEISDIAEGTKRFLLHQTEYEDFESLKNDLVSKTAVISNILDLALPSVEETYEKRQ